MGTFVRLKLWKGPFRRLASSISPVVLFSCLLPMHLINSFKLLGFPLMVIGRA